MVTHLKRPYSTLELRPLDQFERRMSEPTRYERFGVILLDAAGRHLGGAWLSQDCQDGTAFRLRDLARIALHHDAVGMILVHTHPYSKEPTLSRLDVETTRTVHEYFSRIGIAVLDQHIYRTGGEAVFSFAEQHVAWSFDQLGDQLTLEQG